ncbi:MAG: type I glyceraldehyde-3-phosphate dehydrogenase [Gammaproteobacteria bacterium]
MRAIRAGVNGFGRIGRCVLRALAESGRGDIEIVAVNSRADAEIVAHLLQYDSTHGKFAAEVSADGDALVVDGRRIRYTRESAPDEINWKAAGVELILECSGAFNSKKDAVRHLSAGARKVLISAPARDADLSVVFGVNHGLLAGGDFSVVSAASCTTNCLAPVVKTLHDNFGVRRGWMTTVHAMTADQKLLDESHEDLRRARAAGASIIPTKTGAAESIGAILPELRGKLDGIALRAPVANVSLLDLTCELSAAADADSLNAAFVAAAQKMPPGVMTVCAAPLVSSDFNHSVYSAVVDATQTRAFGDWAKVFAWYDNEWGFANRMLDVAAAMGA